jgi:hypothetical protein
MDSLTGAVASTENWGNANLAVCWDVRPISKWVKHPALLSQDSENASGADNQQGSPTRVLCSGAAVTEVLQHRNTSALSEPPQRLHAERSPSWSDDTV